MKLAPPEPWLLSQEERVNIVTRESLEATAGELEAAGLRKLAGIVRLHASERPPEISLTPYQPGTIDHKAWLASMKRRSAYSISLNQSQSAVSRR